jgi:hypothetical protein
MRARGMVLSLCLAAGLMVLPGAANGSALYLDVDGDLLADTEHTVGPGETFEVAVCLSGFGGQTGSFQFDLSYDGDVLALLDYDTWAGQPDTDPGLGGPIQTLAELGPWGSSQWSDPVTQELNQYESGPGLMREYYTAGSFTQTATGDGVLAYLVFEVIGSGQTALELQMPGGTWFLEDVTPQPTATALTITVVPEPSGLLLVATSLALALARRRRRA